MQTPQRNPRELALIVLLMLGAVGYASWFLTGTGARAGTGSRKRADDQERKTRIAELELAAGNGDLARLQAALKTVQPAEVKSSDALQLAAYNGHCEACLALLDYGCDPNGSKGTGGPLRSACQWGFEDIAELLLKRGAPANPDGINRLPPLYLAARRGSARTVRLLLEAGAHVDDLVSPPPSPARGGVVDLPDRAGPFRQPRRQIEPQKRIRGGTALLQAVQQGYADVVQLLIARGADPKRGFTESETPLAVAHRLGFQDIEAELRTASGTN